MQTILCAAVLHDTIEDVDANRKLTRVYHVPAAFLSRSKTR
jgi:hypothetical protein